MENNKINSQEKLILQTFINNFGEFKQNCVTDLKTLFSKEALIYLLFCLLPIVFNFSFYFKLPNEMPILNNNVAIDYIHKNTAIFGFPIFMNIVELIILYITNYPTIKETSSKKILNLINWYIPLISIIVSMLLIIYSLGMEKFIHTGMFFLLGAFVLLFGYYLNIPYDKLSKKLQTKISEQTFLKICKVFKVLIILIGVLIICAIYL